MQKPAAPHGGVDHVPAVRAAVSQLKQQFPAIDQTSLEAHFVLGRTYNMMVEMRAPVWARFGITEPRFMVLRLLFLSRDKRASMSEIAADINKGMANVTQLVDGLVQDGLVERVVAPHDRRVVHARLTPRGEQLFTSVFPENAARIEEAWAPLSDDEKLQMVHLLARMHAHLLARGSERVK
jgi:MarR family 2-MHQ and catechol resistance regulon transcriptional repressor